MSEFKEKARQELIAFVQNSGLTRSESEVAINNCVDKMSEGAEKGFQFGVAVALFMNIPFPAIGPVATIGIITATSGIKAALQVKNAQQCSEIRNAINYWISEKRLLKDLHSEQ